MFANIIIFSHKCTTTPWRPNPEGASLWLKTLVSNEQHSPSWMYDDDEELNGIQFFGWFLYACNIRAQCSLVAKLQVKCKLIQGEDKKVEIKSLMKVLVVGYKVTKLLEIAWLPIFVFHEFLDYLSACNILFVLRAISPSFSSFTLEFNNRILEKTMKERY